MSQKRSMPSRKAIADFWQHKEGWVDLMGYGGEARGNHDDDLMPDECWACGLKYPNGFTAAPDRCHIISRWQGGNDECANLVLLCRTCHQQSENIPTDTFWIWMKSMRRDKWKNQYEWFAERLEMVGLGVDIIKKRFDDGESKEDVWKDVCKRLGLNYAPLPEYVK